MNTLLTITVLLMQQTQVETTRPEPIQHPAEVRRALVEEIAKNIRSRTTSTTDVSVYSTVKVPEDQQQGVFVLHDASGFARPYVQGGFKYVMVSQLHVANRTKQEVRFPLNSIRLRVGGDEYAHQPWLGTRSTSVRLRGSSYRLKPRDKVEQGTAGEVVLKPGEVKQIHAIFHNVPQGGAYESLSITVTGLAKPVRIDLLAGAVESMQLQLTRTGPRDCLAIVTLGGSLDQVGAHALVQKLQSSVNAGASRLVILWGNIGDKSVRQSRRVDFSIKTWLTQSAAGNPRYSHLPSMPVGLQEIHLGPFPEGQATATAPDRKPHAHNSKLKAISAALSDVYQRLPIKDVLAAISSDDMTIRIAAIRGGVGRLPSSAVPMLLTLADGEEDVKLAAIHALSQFPESAAIDRVADFVTDKDRALASVATNGLMSSRFPSAQEKLVGLVGSLEGKQRDGVAEILIAKPNAIWTDLYFEYASNYESNVSLALRAFGALDRIGHPRLRELRAAALESDQDSVRRSAFRALATSGSVEDTRLVVEYSLRHIANQPPTPEMLNVLRNAPTGKATPHLMRHFHAEKSATKRNRLLGAIIQAGDQSIVPFLLETYRGTKGGQLPDPLKVTILNTLHSRRVPEAVDLAVEAMTSSNATLLSSACRILEEAATPRAVAAITDMLIATSSPSKSRSLGTPRLQGLRSLGNIATPQARRYLRIVQNKGNDRDSAAAESQLRALLLRSPAIDYLPQASTLREEKKLAEAEDTYAEALKADPALPEIYIQRGHMKTHNGRRSEGVQDFDLALEIDPLHPIATSLKAIAIVVLGDPDGGLKMVEENAETFKRDEVFNYNAACAYGQALKTNKPTTDNLAKRKKWRDRGLYFLEHCVNELNYAGENREEDAELFQNDPDLDPFRKEDRFKKLWEKVRPNLPSREEAPEERPPEQQKKAPEDQ